MVLWSDCWWGWRLLYKKSDLGGIGLKEGGIPESKDEGNSDYVFTNKS